jgi:hypothetical protein
MKTLKQILLESPEYLLVLAVIFYWSSSAILNPIAITLLIVLVCQIIYKNKVVGIIIPTLLILSSLYMLLALLSEFREFPTFNYEAKKLLFVGLTFFISTIIVSGIMIYKYSVLAYTKSNIFEV